jgi:hypothetical protein
VIYFSGDKLTEEMMAGTQIDVLAEKLALNSFEIGKTGTLVIPSLVVYY